MLSNEWRKSTFSNPDGAACVETKIENGMVHLRDTKDRSKSAHVFNLDEWTAFIAGVKDGQFDPPAA